MDSPKVLIADADESYRRYLSEFLTRKDDFSVFDVGNGELAVDVAAKELPNVIVLDIILPDMSGFDLCKKLKSDERLKYIPVIIHSASAGFRVRLNAFVAGAHKYLSKPCSMEDIYSSVRGALRIYDA